MSKPHEHDHDHDHAGRRLAEERREGAVFRNLAHDLALALNRGGFGQRSKSKSKTRSMADAFTTKKNRVSKSGGDRETRGMFRISTTGVLGEHPVSTVQGRYRKS